MMGGSKVSNFWGGFETRGCHECQQSPCFLRATIRLLKDFNDKIFTKHPSENLCIEDLCLTRLTEEIKINFDAGMYNF